MWNFSLLIFCDLKPAHLSTYQLNTWGDLLERLLPKALTIAQQEDIEYRKGLPRDYLDYTGVSKSDLGSKQRDPFIKKVS